MPKSRQLLGKDIPYVQAHHVGAKQRPTAVVLRTSFTTGDAGAALGIARTWHSPVNKIDSCHYVVDELQTIRCLPDNLACRSIFASGYRRAIMINVCYDPPQPPVERVVYHTAKQVARLCKLHRIRVQILDQWEEVRWLQHPWKHRGGIILATSGNFPTHNFLSSVKEEYKKFD